MKKNKIIAIFTSIVLGVTCLTGCGGSTENKDDAQSNKLVIYSPNSEDIINTIIPSFEEETGIDVEIVSAGTGELFKRIESEKNNPYADVLFGGSRAQYMQKPELFEEYVSKNDSNIMDEYKNKTGYITHYVADGSVILVNKNLIGDIKVEGYEDLLNPELKGKITGADPTSSSSAFAQLTNMLLAMGGDYTSDEGWNYVKNLVSNMEGKVASGSGAVHKSVADGEYTVGLTYEDPSASYVISGAPVEIIYPKEGTVFLAAGSGIIKGAKNIENAEKFIDFITSKTAQDIFGTQLTNRPVSKDAELGTHMKSMDDINLIYEDTDYIDAHKDEIVEKYKSIITSEK